MGCRRLVLSCVIAGACRQPAEPRVVATPPSDARADAPVPIGTLHAEVVVEKPVVARIQDVRVVVTLTNQSGGPWPVRTEFLNAGSLALEVRDLASGARLNPGPPPMPPAAKQSGTYRTLAAGEAMTFTCDPNIATDHTPGRFEVRFRGVPADPKNQDITSPWAQFTVGP